MLYFIANPSSSSQVSSIHFTQSKMKNEECENVNLRCFEVKWPIVGTHLIFNTVFYFINLYVFVPEK